METTVLTLTDFLLARIAEDEVGARAWQSDRRPFPDRPLAECEAKRRIVGELSPVVDYDRDRFIVPATSLEAAATRALRHLVAVYADHPDYRDEWSPDA